MKTVYTVLLMSVLTFSGCHGDGASNVPEDFLTVSGGRFVMGCPENETGSTADEHVQRRIKVDSFLLQRHEVTFEEYDLFCEDTNREKPYDCLWGRGRLPVVNISWYEAVDYCNWLSLQEGLQPAYHVNGTDVRWNRRAGGYRLPTEAEWEYACRAGTTGPFSTGVNLTTDQANYDGQRPYGDFPLGILRNKTMPVGSFDPNPWGFYDMHGNVYEWCWDWYAGYDPSSTRNPAGPDSGSAKILRGGSWNLSAFHCRSAHRFNYDVGSRRYYAGMRLARNL